VLETKQAKYFILILLLVFLLCLLPVFSGCQTTGKKVAPKVKPALSSPAVGSSIALTGKYRTLTIADLNNDGKPDIVGGVVGRPSVAIWYGQGDGSVSKPAFLPFKADVYSVAAADVNEDGLKDLILAVQQEISGVMVWLNNTDGAWKRGLAPTSINEYQSVRTADIDMDGHMDIIAANSTTDFHGGIQLWLGNGRGGWNFEAGPTITGKYMDAVVADFNGDGRPDIAGAGWGTYGSLRVWLGDGSGGWKATEVISKGSFYRLAPGDINGDGHLDIIAGTYRNGVRVFTGDGRGGFMEMAGPDHDPVTMKGPGSDAGITFDKMRKANSYWQAVPFDLDGDGNMEIFAGSPEGKGMKLWKLSSSGAWKEIDAQLPATGTFYDLVVADIDKDGYEEICAASYGEGIKIWSTRHGKITAKEIRTREEIGVAVKKPTLEQVQENEVFVMVDGKPEYKIGPLDTLEITNWQGVEAKKEEVRVTADGKISIGFIDDLEAAGLTERQLDEKITRLLGRYIKNPSIDVRVKTYRSHSVMVLGAIIPSDRGGPGRYPLSGRTTVLEAISIAGGTRLDANLGAIRIRSKNGKSSTLNLFKTMLEGDQSQNITVDNEDMIYVPQITKEDNRVYVFGEVNKPGIITFKGGKLSMFDAIAQAGGVTVFAHEEDTRIVRGDISQPEVILADYEKLVEEGDYTQNVDLINGDLVYVPRSAMGSVNRFVKRIQPLLELIYIPGRIARDVEDLDAAMQRLRE
jgi:polysaccharide export outer membrane protein